MKRLLKLLGKSLYVNTLPTDLLRSDVPIGRVKELFSTYVDLVEIENHSYCNRTCWFCPNVFLDRRSVNHVMHDALFAKILKDLSEIDYSATLVWSRYHEPMADKSIFGRVAKARKVLPHARLTLTSNGDYLNPETLSALEQAGLDRLLLDLYLPDHRERDEDELAAALQKFRNRTHLEVVDKGPREYLVKGSPIKITMGAPIYTQEGMSTRGGLMDIPKARTYRRAAVCLAPVRHVVVDYNGKGMLCCQTRSDSPEHQGAIIGDISQPAYSLFHFYRDLAPARATLASPGAKGGPCKTCDVSDDGPDLLARRPLVTATLKSVGADRIIQKALFRGARRYE